MRSRDWKNSPGTTRYRRPNAPAGHDNDRFVLVKRLRRTVERTRVA
jgi:hypothetical protein